MEPWVWAVPVVILVVVVARAKQPRKLSAFQNLLEGVASRVEGRVVPEAGFGYPRLIVAGVPEIAVSTMRGGEAGGTRSGPITYATFQLGAFDVKRGKFRVVRRQRSIQDAVDAHFQKSTPLGDPQFEKEFLIWRSDPAVVRALLDAELMQDLSSYPREADVALTLSCGECTVSTCNVAKSEEQIQKLIDTALLLRVRMRQVQGIER